MRIRSIPIRWLAVAAGLLCLACLGASPGTAADEPGRRPAAPPGIQDRFNLFPAVGAMIVVRGPNQVGLPEGIGAFCSGSLIHPQVFMTAGHCTGPGSFAGLPPFVTVFVSLSPNALDPSSWRPVVQLITHPSIPPCPPPIGCDPTTLDVFHAPDPGISDVGLALLAEPVADVQPVRIAPVRTLESQTARRGPMITVGYGFPRVEPDGEVPDISEWDGWRRIRASRMKRVVDDTWAAWTLPSQICYGDSGSSTFFKPPSSGLSNLSVVAVASDGGIDCISADYRARVDTPAVQQWIADTIRQHVASQ